MEFRGQDNQKLRDTNFNRKDSLINKLDSLSNVHLKINFILSFFLLLFTAMAIFMISMYKLESISLPNEDFGHVSLWRYSDGVIDYHVWFIFWGNNFDTKCANRNTGNI